MTVFKFFIDYDKEEKWLELMAEKGYELVSASFGYTFRNTKAERATIRIDYRTFKKHEDFIDYCTLFEDSGWKHIAGTKNSGTQYFKKIDENSQEDIFSDTLSKAGKYKRLSSMWMSLAASYVPFFIVLLSRGNFMQVEKILNPQSLYLTPGLWEMSGSKFWSHFLFETPFAMLRGFAWAVFPITIAFYIGFAVKAKRMYYKVKKANQEYH